MYSLRDLVNKLVLQYKNHKQIIIAYDFDDTVRMWSNEDEAFNLNAKPCLKIINLLNKVNRIANAKFICYTARETNEQTCTYIKKYCKKYNIPLDTINENIIPWHPSPSKLFFNILLDDKSGLRDACLALDMFLDEITLENKIEDDIYLGIWSGYTIQIYNLDGYVATITHTEGIRGSTKCAVIMKNNKILKIIEN